MHYTMRGGVQHSWRHRATGLLRHIRSHNWLPMAAALIITAWLALIVSGFSQTPPAAPTPQTQASSDTDSIPVGYKTNTPDNITATSATTHADVSQPTTNTATAGSSTVAAAPISAPTASTDEKSNTPATTPTNPQVSSSQNAETTNESVQFDIGLGSLLHVSAGVGGNNLLQADVGLGL